MIYFEGSYFFMYLFIGRIIMIKEFKEVNVVDVSYIISLIFLCFYTSNSRNILDFVYLLILSFCYIRIKYCRWKKYH